MKKFSVVALILVLAISFTGCTANEQKLYNALMKNQEIISMESDTDITFSLEGKDFPKEQQEILKEIIKNVNNSQINIHQKTVSNEDKTVAKAQANMNLIFGDNKMPMEVWVNVDASKDNPNIVEIIKMPSDIMKMISPEDGNKQYIIYDIDKIMSETSQEVDNSKIMEFSKDFQTKYVDFIKDYIKKFDPGFKMATYKGTRSVNGKSLYLYEVKLDDANFKKLIRNTVNNSLEDKDTIKFIEEYMNAVVDIMEIPEGEQLSKEEMKQELVELKKEIPNFKVQFNEFMDKIEDVKVIGDKGIVIEYGVNSAGYIVHEAGNVDLSIDLESIEKTFGNTEEEQSSTAVKQTGILKLGIDFNTKIYNIDKDFKINMPNTNEQNSIRMSDLMKDTIVETEETIE